ncbi:MAG: hypothetical protein AB8F94_12200 [Saprospiraceae bacterium]
MEKKLFDEVLDHGLVVDLKLNATRKSEHTMLLTFGIIVGFLISGWLFQIAFEPPYVDLSYFSFALILAIITLKYLYNLINFKRLYFTPTKVIIHTTLFGKKYKNNIVGFGYREGTAGTEKKEEDKIAILFSNGEYELIGSSSIFNFHQTEQFLRKHYNNIGDKAFKGKDKLTFQGCLAILLFSSLFFSGSFLLNGLGRDNLEGFENNIKSFEIILESAPKKNDNSYTLKSQEHPNFVFDISGISFQACNNNLNKNFTRGDIFNIGIQKSIYDSKILKNSEPNFWTKHFNWENISVYHLAINGENIIEKKGVREKLENDTNYFSLISGLILFALFLLGTLMYFTLP